MHGSQTQSNSRVKIRTTDRRTIITIGPRKSTIILIFLSTSLLFWTVTELIFLKRTFQQSTETLSIQELAGIVVWGIIGLLLLHLWLSEILRTCVINATPVYITRTTHNYFGPTTKKFQTSRMGPLSIHHYENDESLTPSYCVIFNYNNRRHAIGDCDSSLSKEQAELIKRELEGVLRR